MPDAGAGGRGRRKNLAGLSLDPSCRRPTRGGSARTAPAWTVEGIQGGERRHGRWRADVLLRGELRPIDACMKIIDAQVHIWSQTVTPTSGLHRKVAQFAAEDLLPEMDEAGGDAALIHPPRGWDPDSNALAIEAVRKYPDRFAIMGNFALDNPDERQRVHGWRKQPGMMGLRWPLLLEQHQKWLYDGSLDWLWPAAEAEGLPIAMMGGLFLPKFREIAERHPRLRMMLDHCGLNRHGRDIEAFVHF